MLTCNVLPRILGLLQQLMATSQSETCSCCQMVHASKQSFNKVPVFLLQRFALWQCQEGARLKYTLQSLVCFTTVTRSRCCDASLFTCDLQTVVSFSKLVSWLVGALSPSTTENYIRASFLKVEDDSLYSWDGGWNLGLASSCHSPHWRLMSSGSLWGFLPLSTTGLACVVFASSLASLSVCSFPAVPQCAGIHTIQDGSLWHTSQRDCWVCVCRSRGASR